MRVELPTFKQRIFDSSWQRSRETRLLIFLIVSGVAVGVKRHDFLQLSNLTDVLVNASPLIIAAAGATVVIVAGGIDISIGSLFGACAIAAGIAAKSVALETLGVNPIVMALLAPVVLGTAIGVWNGAMITLAGIPPIIATLGMLSIIRGVTIYVTGGNEIRDLPDIFRALSLNAWFGIPNPILLALIVVAMAMMFLLVTRLGREMYALGGNATAATLAAIRVPRLRLLSYAIGGLCVGIAAVIYAARFSSIQTTTGTGFELTVITSVVLGGTSILGGSGTVFGSALGAIVLQVIPNALTFLGVPEFWKPAAQGAVVLLAVLSSASARRER